MTWQRNADEYDELVAMNTNLHLALLVAGAVGAGEGQATVEEFATVAEVEPRQVRYYLNTWNRFARDEGLPTAEDLTPDTAQVLMLTQSQADEFERRTS